MVDLALHRSEIRSGCRVCGCIEQGLSFRLQSVKAKIKLVGADRVKSIAQLSIPQSFDVSAVVCL